MLFPLALGGLGRNRAPVASGGPDIAILNLYTTGDSVTNTTALTTASRSYNNGTGGLFVVRWGAGTGGNTRTISTITCSTGETCNIIGSPRQSITGVWAQFFTVNAFSSTASRTFTVTMSGQVADAIEIPWSVNLSNVISGTIAGALGGGGNAFGDQTVTLSPNCAAGSAIFFMNSATNSSTTGTIQSGYTAITCPATAFSSASDGPYAGYVLNAGGAGSKTAGYQAGGSGGWSIIAIEIFKA